MLFKLRKNAETDGTIRQLTDHALDHVCGAGSKAGGVTDGRTVLGSKPGGVGDGIAAFGIVAL